MRALSDVKRYWRVWRAFAHSCLVREMSFRASFYMGVFRNMIWLGLALINIEVLFSYTDAIVDWTKSEMLLLLGVTRLAQDVTDFAFRSNMERISDYILLGEMDFIMLKPISSQFVATLRYVRWHRLPQALINVGLIGYALSSMAHTLSLWHVLLFIGILGAGLVMVYAVWLAISTLSFWLVRQAPNVSELFDALYGAVQYPKTIFPDLLQFVVTYVVPLAFVAMFPAQALLGALDWRMALLAVPLAALSAFLSHRFWVFGTRSYTSASS